jgi:hypothetical protein
MHLRMRGRVWEGMCREGKQEVLREEGMEGSRRCHCRVYLACVYACVCACVFVCVRAPACVHVFIVCLPAFAASRPAVRQQPAMRASAGAQPVLRVTEAPPSRAPARPAQTS